MPVSVWMYVDPFTSMVSEELASREEITPVEYEYRELENIFKEACPEIEFKFKRDMLPSQLANAMPAIYLWDIGGMCVSDFSGERRWGFCKDIVTQINEHPNTGFVPWSAMTIRDTRGVLEELIDEEGFNDKKFPPNLFLTERNDFEEREKAKAWIAKWFISYGDKK